MFDILRDTNNEYYRRCLCHNLINYLDGYGHWTRICVSKNCKAYVEEIKNIIESEDDNNEND